MDTLKILQQQLQDIAKAAIEHSPNIIAAVVLLLVTWLAAKLARRIASKLMPGVGSRSLSLAIRKLLVIGV